MTGVAAPDDVVFRLLGPVQMHLAARNIDLGPDKQRCLIAALLMTPGTAVPVDELADRLWGDDIPRRVRNVLATYITRLRRLVGQAPAVRLRYAYGGYLLECDPALVDLHRYRRLMVEAASGSAATVAESCRLLLAGWESVALAGISGDWAARMRESLQQQRLAVVARWAEAELDLGRSHLVVQELRDLVTQHPGAEEIMAPYMIALARIGYPAKALQCFEQLRQALAAQLGADPAPRLQEIHRSILRCDPDPDPARVTVALPRHSRGPAQLPLDVRGFGGRTEQLDRLDAMLDGSAAMVCVISGTAGVGKTALAVRWAHRMRDRFPDGQLYLNLHGFDASGEATTASAAIHRLLTSLGVHPASIPADLESQMSIYRSELDGKRLVLLLDNARDAAQVRPLLPGDACTALLITSRDQLTSLVALEGADHIVLDLLSHDEALHLLAMRLGPARVAAEPQAAADIVACCARLPLALTVAAGRAAQRQRPLKEIAEELADTGARLDFLTAGDSVSEVRSVFSWSYQILQPMSARLFRLLGLHFAPDFCPAAAAALLGIGVPEVKPLLDDLTRASLLTEAPGGRYTCHDLLRAYAADRAHEEDPHEHREQAIDRMLRHYLHTAHAADRLLCPLRDPMTRPIPSSSQEVATQRLANAVDAMEWFTTEQPALLSALRHCQLSKLDVYTWQFAWVLTTFLTRRGPWSELAGAWAGALRAAERLVDPVMRADAHRHLGQVNTDLHHFDDSVEDLRRAMQLYRANTNPAGAGHTSYRMALLRDRQGQPTAALRHAREAYADFVVAGHLPGQAMALNGVAWCQVEVGRCEQALADGERALTLFRSLGDEHGQADTWDTMGYAHHARGEHGRAASCYLAAVELFRRCGDRYYEAGSLMRLGDTYAAAANLANARAAWQQSLVILTEQGHPVAAQVTARLQAS